MPIFRMPVVVHANFPHANLPHANSPATLIYTCIKLYEKYILSDALPQGIFWRRYVNDIFCLWPRGRNIDEFMLVINDLVTSVTFTFERENNEQ